jgi:chaperonin GroES
MKTLKKNSKPLSKQSSIGITPLRDKIVVSPITEEIKTAGGIILSEQPKEEQPGMGIVEAVGPGEYENGKFVPTTIKVGTKILFPPFGTDAAMVNGKKYFIMREAIVLATFD